MISVSAHVQNVQNDRKSFFKIFFYFFKKMFKLTPNCPKRPPNRKKVTKLKFWKNLKFQIFFDFFKIKSKNVQNANFRANFRCFYRCSDVFEHFHFCQNVHFDGQFEHFWGKFCEFSGQFL
jgi:hypothetical protein